MDLILEMRQKMKLQKKLTHQEAALKDTSEDIDERRQEANQLIEIIII